jgi:hypothetical protein
MSHTFDNFELSFHTLWAYIVVFSTYYNIVQGMELETLVVLRRPTHTTQSTLAYNRYYTILLAFVGISLSKHDVQTLSCDILQPFVEFVWMGYEVIFWE